MLQGEKLAQGKNKQHSEFPVIAIYPVGGNLAIARFVFYKLHK
jgi:hypothetical protein